MKRMLISNAIGLCFFFAVYFIMYVINLNMIEKVPDWFMFAFSGYAHGSSEENFIAYCNKYNYLK